MDEKEKLKFKQRYADLPDGTLLELLNDGEDGLVKGAYPILREELIKRKLIDENFKEPSPQNESKLLKEKKQHGFVLGYFWVVKCSIYGAVSFFWGFIGGVQTEYLSNRFVSFSLSYLTLGAAIGLIRKERYGLFLTYILLGMDILNFLSVFYLTDQWKISLNAGLAIISVLWFVYFSHRADRFRSTKFDKPMVLIAIIFILGVIVNSVLHHFNRSV